MIRYVTFDYENDSFWHIYSLEQEPDGADVSMTLLTVEAPLTEEWQARVQAATDAINEALSGLFTGATEERKKA